MNIKTSHLFLLPGLDGTGQLFQPFLKLLPHPYSAQVVSYPANKKLNYAELRPLVESALPSDAPFVLLAESFSGPLAVEIAAAKPEQLAAVILSTSFVRNPLPQSLQWLNCSVNPLCFAVPLPRWVMRVFLLGHDCPNELLDQTKAAVRTVAPEVFAFRVRQVMGVDVSESLKSVKVPMLYLAATQDRLVGQRGWQAISSLRPDVKKVEIEGPHLLLQRKPAEAMKAIIRFLESTKIT